jgi:alkanesulfonate monooxygenase SsuD/methylene tetrahydromethanopterin reductase-like flavin-dependent oxidoreductase (luciferase family)
MEIGLQLSDFTWPGGAITLSADLAETAQAADEAGFGYLAVMDHFFQIPGAGPVRGRDHPGRRLTGLAPVVGDLHAGRRGP